MSLFLLFVFFFFNDTATTEIYTLSLHDALPISKLIEWLTVMKKFHTRFVIQYRYLLSLYKDYMIYNVPLRSEEHTSELQSQSNLVCRLLLEKNTRVKYYSTKFKAKGHYISYSLY